MDLFDLTRPDPKPERPAPPARPAQASPSGPSPLALGGLDDESAAQAEFKEKFSAHQEHLAARRETLFKHVNAWLEAERPMVETFNSAMVGQTHRTTWDELWPVICAINAMPARQRQCVVVLGGWFINCKALRAEPVQPSEQLRRDLILHATHQEVLDRISKWRAAYNEKDKAAWLRSVEEFARRYKTFGPCFQSGDWFNAVWSHAQEQESHLLGLVLDQLYCLRLPVFWFFPTPQKLTAGWQDFWLFAWSYQRLPDRERNTFGPYYFALRPAQAKPAR
jgi:hypothetical protein